MRTFLMTTASAATLMLATPVLAQDDPKGVELGINGYLKMYGVHIDQDTSSSSEERNIDIIRDGELHFNGSMTLDNGLTVGADVGATYDQGDSFAVTDTWVWFEGSWGHVNFGATDGAAYLLGVQAPAADANYDGMDQFYQPVNYSITGVSELSSMEFDYDHDVDGASDKLTYITPIFSGFQGGISYSPEAKTASRGLDGVSADNEAGDLGDIWDVALRYSGEFSGFKLNAGTGYTHANLEETGGSDAPHDDRNMWNAGVDLDIGQFGIGAVYVHDDRGELDGSDSDQRQIILGADYNWGVHTVGVSYLNQTNEFGSNDIDTQRYTAGITHHMGPGLDFRGIVSHINHDVDTALGSDVDATSVMLGTSLSF